MPWAKPTGSETNPSVDQIIRRLAYHMHHRTLEPEVAELVLKTARITRKTLNRYCAYRPTDFSATSDLHANGPRRLDIYYQICIAIGENPGKVLWAATVAGDYPSMLALLNAEVHLQQTLLVSGGLGMPNTATTRLVAMAAGDAGPRHASG